MAKERLQNTINELLERANKAVLDSDWESVKKSSETVLGLDEGNEEAKKLDAKGLPASKLFRRYLAIAEEAGIKLPHKYNIK